MTQFITVTEDTSGTITINVDAIVSYRPHNALTEIVLANGTTLHVKDGVVTIEALIQASSLP